MHRAECLKGCLESKKCGKGGDGDIHTWVNFCFCLHIRDICSFYISIGLPYKISFEERDNQLKNNWKPVHQTKASLQLVRSGLVCDKVVFVGWFNSETYKSRRVCTEEFQCQHEWGGEHASSMHLNLKSSVIKKWTRMPLI